MTTPLAPIRSIPARTIKRAVTRLYSDTGQLSAVIYWSDGSATFGRAVGPLEPDGPHMVALFERAKRDGLTVEHEVW